ncbi:MAG: hypothetical protein AAF488_19485 [Planctomycetota bacterium]
MKHLAFLILAATLNSGCATRPTAEEMTRLRSVRISEVVEKQVTYSGRLPSEYEVDQGNGLLSIPILAPIGFLVELWNYDDTSRRKQERLKRILDDTDLDMVGTVRTHLEELTPSLVPASAHECEDPIDGEVRIELRYGLSGMMGLGSDWIPWLEVRAIMVDQTGRELWEEVVDATVGDGNVHPLPFPDPFHSRTQVRRQYEAAALVACRRLIATYLEDN